MFQPSVEHKNVKNKNSFVSEKKLNDDVGKCEYNHEWDTAIELPQQSYSRKKSDKPLLTA